MTRGVRRGRVMRVGRRSRAVRGAPKTLATHVGRAVPRTRAPRAVRTDLVDRAERVAREIRAEGSVPTVSHVDEQGRLEPPIAAGEVDTLLGYLDYQRATLEWKTRGLGADGLGARTAASTMTLGGLLKHMAWVEEHWFSHRLHGREFGPPWNGVDWAADNRWEFTSAAGDSPDQLRALWQRAVEASRADVRRAIDGGGLDVLCVRPWPNGESPSLRWVLVHMIEEYARHNGHADLLRESIDGETGE